MTPILALIVAQALTPPPAVRWPELPPFPLPASAITPAAAAFVRGEVAAGRCIVPAPAPTTGSTGARFSVPVAILVGPTGLVRQVVPQAVDCPTVEQFTVGYLLAVTRNSADRAAPAPGWYRATIDYRW